MRRTLGWILGSVLVVGAVLIGWVYFAGGSGEPTTELTTPSLAVETSSSALGSTAPVEETVQSNMCRRL